MRLAKILRNDHKSHRPIRCGDGFAIRFHYHVKEPIRNAHFGLQIHTDPGILATELSTWRMSLEIPLLMPGEGCIDAVVESANPSPARYLGSPWVASFGVGDYGLVPHAVVLDEESSGVYKSGRGLQPAKGLSISSASGSSTRTLQLYPLFNDYPSDAGPFPQRRGLKEQG